MWPHGGGGGLWGLEAFEVSLVPGKLVGRGFQDPGLLRGVHGVGAGSGGLGSALCPERPGDGGLLLGIGNYLYLLICYFDW